MLQVIHAPKQMASSSADRRRDSAASVAGCSVDELRPIARDVLDPLAQLSRRLARRNESSTRRHALPRSASSAIQLAESAHPDQSGSPSPCFAYLVTAPPTYPTQLRHIKMYQMLLIKPRSGARQGGREGGEATRGLKGEWCRGLTCFVTRIGLVNLLHFPCFLCFLACFCLTYAITFRAQSPCARALFARC